MTKNQIIDEEIRQAIKELSNMLEELKLTEIQIEIINLEKLESQDKTTYLKHRIFLIQKRVQIIMISLIKSLLMKMTKILLNHQWLELSIFSLNLVQIHL